MNAIRILLMLIMFLCVNLSVVYAAPQQFSAEGEYRLGDRDTREDAKKFALAEAKRKIVEQAGVYVESYTEVNNFKVSQDKIQIVTQALITVKTERTEFTENGVVCKAYVTATIDVESMENQLMNLVKKFEREAEKRENERRAAEKRESERREIERDSNKPTNISKPSTSTSRDKKSSKPALDTQEYDVPKDLSSDFAELEEARNKMVRDLSKATAYTAGSEYKLQEVTGIADREGYHDEKGEISNYLKENFDMNKNYRFAELTPFVEAVGADKIIRVLEEINKKKILDAKDRMTWAKIERARAKSYGEIVLKEAADLFKRAEELMVDAGDNDRERLRIIRREADDAIKLIKALELRNKDVDEVAKKYEKANKITAKNDKYNPKKKKNFFSELEELFK